MRKSASLVVLGLLLLSETVLALTYVGKDKSGYLVFSSDRIAVKINPEKDTMYINNIIGLLPFPKISLEGKTMEMPFPRYTEPSPGKSLDSFSIRYPEGFLEDVYATVKIKLTDKLVEQEIVVENRKNKDVVIGIDLSNDTRSFFVFAPYKEYQDRNYLFLSPSSMKLYGRILTVFFDPTPPSYNLNSTEFEVSGRDILKWAVRVPTGKRYTLKLKYLNSYLALTNATEGFPIKSGINWGPFLLVETDPILDTFHQEKLDEIKPKIDTKKPVLDVLSQIINYVDELKEDDHDFSFDTHLDWDLVIKKGKYNSLEKALLVREFCREVGIPAKLVIGESKSGKYYAWVKAYAGNVERLYDPFGESKNYKKVYEEPEPFLCRDDPWSCRPESVITVGLVCFGPVCINLIFVAGIIVVITLAVFIFITYKSETIARLLAEKPERRIDLSGSYNILKDSIEIDDPFLKDVFEYIKERSGIVQIDEIATKLGYSRTLVNSAIEKLIEDGVISRKFS